MEDKNPAQSIIEDLGGLTKVAEALSTPDKSFAVSTVQGWKDRGTIPQKYWQALQGAGIAAGKEIALSRFLGISEHAA